MRTKPIQSAIAAASLALVLGTALPAAAQQDTDALTQRLFTAVRANDIATVRLVLTNGADPMAVDANGQTPAGIAIDRGYFEIAHHVLGVRNQRQAMTRRDSDDDRNARPGTRTASAVPAAPGEERRPEPTWRQNTVPGQAAEIPPARVSSPQEATVITPAMVITGPTPRSASPTTTPASKKGAEKGPSSGAISGPGIVPPAPAPQQATLANLPVLPAGAPNPFDPKSAEPEALPVLSSTAPAVRPEAASNAEKSRETSSGNALSRFFNGITGVFSGGGS